MRRRRNEPEMNSSNKNLEISNRRFESELPKEAEAEARQEEENLSINTITSVGRSQQMAPRRRDDASKVGRCTTSTAPKTTTNLKRSLMHMALLLFIVVIQEAKTAPPPPQLQSASQVAPHSSSGRDRRAPSVAQLAVSGTTAANSAGATTTTTNATKTIGPSSLSASLAQQHKLPQMEISSPGVRDYARLEEEVSLISGDSSTVAAAANRAWRRQRAHTNQRTPHLIKIQATLNGKLMAPIRTADNGTGNGSAQLMVATSSEEPKLAPAAAETSTAQWRPVRPSSPAANSTASSSLDSTTTTLATDTESCQQQQATTESQQASSIAATSQTLRLTTNAKSVNRTLMQHLLSAEVPGGGGNSGELESSSAATALAIELNPSKLQPAVSGGRADTASASAQHQQQAATPRMMSVSESLFLPTPEQQQQQRQSAGGDSILALVDDYDSKIITNRTKAQLSCDSGEMVLRLNFSDSFKGIVYPDHNRLSPCRFFGDGHHNYELRLPLRGCGTRQAAPRVFVNDVIVRFHKTLELEEDEVKTLICRYPPPLPDGPTLNPAVIGNRQSAPTDNSVIEQEGPAQFEFVDSLSGRPRLPAEPGGGNSGNIETLSENLIISGQQHNLGGSVPAVDSKQHEPLAAYGGGLPKAGGMRHRGEQPADWSNSRNSLLLEQPPAGGGGQQASSGLLERFSSIELLFIISSLMFLVLLMLGLATSYYCFRRQAHRGSVQRASAILKRKRRYIGPGALLHDHSSAAARAAAAGPSQAALQQYYSQRMAATGRHRRPSLTAPSSPESDLSARRLLAPGAGHMASYRSTQHNYHPSYNQAFVPDNAATTHYAATPYMPAGYSMPEGATTAGRGRQRSMQQQLVVAGGNAGGHQPVVGRRGDTAAIYGGPQPRYLSPAAISRPPRHPHTQFAPPFGPGGHPLKAGGNTLTRLDRPPVDMAFAAGNRLDQHHSQAEHYDDQPSGGHLSRAKSLSSVRYLEPLVGGPPTSPDHFVGGTEAVRGRRRRQRAPEGTELPTGRRSAMRVRPVSSNLHAATKEYSSDSEVEPNNNNVNIIGSAKRLSNHHHQKPSILLKSIEDSYITNFTEIYEQEYIKQDSTRPLSMGQWRAMQPLTAQADRKKKPEAATFSDDADLKDHERRDDDGQDDDDDDDDDETIKGQDGGEQRYTHANLRSLTELDVNFAKSLLVPSLRPAMSADQLTVKTALTSEGPATSLSDVEAGGGTPPTTEPKVRSTSAPQVAADATQNPHSPDLILSPDYDHDRLELKSHQDSTSSHNSVSYV